MINTREKINQVVPLGPGDTVTYMVILTREGYWGRGRTWAEAAKYAHCLNRAKTGITRGKDAMGYKIKITGGLTQEQIDSDAELAKHYRVGEVFEPFVDSYGRLHWFNGEMERFESIKSFHDL